MDLLPLIIAMWWVQHSPIRIEKKLHCRDLIGRHIKCEIRITIMIQFQGRLLVMIQICGHTVRIFLIWTEGSFQILWKSKFSCKSFFINEPGPKWTVLSRTERSFSSKWTIIGLKPDSSCKEKWTLGRSILMLDLCETFNSEISPFIFSLVNKTEIWKGYM